MLATVSILVVDEPVDDKLVPLSDEELADIHISRGITEFFAALELQRRTEADRAA